MGQGREAAEGAGGGASATWAGEGKDSSAIGSIIYIYIYIYMFFFVVSLAGRESQLQVDNEGENDQADDANGRALGVDGNRCEGAGREGDDGNNDGSLRHWLRFYFEGKFHQGSQRQRGEW